MSEEREEDECSNCVSIWYLACNSCNSIMLRFKYVEFVLK